MFYEPKNGVPLPHNPLNAIVVPRPIGWISTLSAKGVPNLAPYSFFNAVAYYPPQVMFSATSNHRFGGLKDAVADARATTSPLGGPFAEASPSAPEPSRWRWRPRSQRTQANSYP